MNGPVEIVVPVSGGKDSQSCLKLAMHRFQTHKVVGLFCDTQFEHPITYDHIARLEDLYQIKIYTVSAGSVPEKVLKHKCFPNMKARYCTSELKIRESKIWYEDFYLYNGPFEVWYGIRINESRNRMKKYNHLDKDDLIAPHEFLPNHYPQSLAKKGIMFRMPIINWSTEYVFHFLDGEENPLYRMGFDRVGCFPCLASSDANKNAHFNFDKFGKNQRKIVEELEIKIGKSSWKTKKNEDRYSSGSGCSICEM